jgi:hypothetical protein
MHRGRSPVTAAGTRMRVIARASAGVSRVVTDRRHRPPLYCLPRSISWELGGGNRGAQARARGQKAIPARSPSRRRGTRPVGSACARCHSPSRMPIDGASRHGGAFGCGRAPCFAMAVGSVAAARTTRANVAEHQRSALALSASVRPAAAQIVASQGIVARQAQNGIMQLGRSNGAARFEVPVGTRFGSLRWGAKPRTSQAAVPVNIVSHEVVGQWHYRYARLRSAAIKRWGGHFLLS